MKLSFHGAAQNVTGSCHLLQCAGLRILIDCGMFQGRQHTDEENAGAFGFEPSEIDVLLLTHAHLDHCGRIPLLVKRGFKGEIICTAPTRDLAELIMMDSAKIQEEDAARATRQRRRQGKSPITPLYTIPDVLAALKRFGRVVAYEEPLKISEGIDARFINAGHILGAASVVIDAVEEGKSRRIVFSGDIGNRGHQLLPDPTPPPTADYVVVESTYGDRQHRPLDGSIKELLEAVRETLSRGGNVIIPTFALERTQEVLFYLAKGIDEDVFAANTPVFLDSPMAISATEIFRSHPEGFRDHLRRGMSRGADPFVLPGLRLTRDVVDSILINRVRGGAIIMAGSGMCTGGRVRHHMKQNIWRKECSIVFVGFAALGTLARDIIDGAKSVRLQGKDMPVNAKIYTINGFSAHADQQELLDWLGTTGKPRMTFLVHGERDGGMEGLRQELERKGLPVRCPELHEAVDL